WISGQFGSMHTCSLQMRSCQSLASSWCVSLLAHFSLVALPAASSLAWVRLIVCVLSIVLYAIAGALAAQYIVEPAIGDDFLTAWSLAVSIVVGLALLILTGIVSLSASALGAFVRRTSV